ncbi:MAG: hypothetical protein ACOX31_03570 [Eubacteriales bacterium]|jgi:hypothetical protein
MFSLAKETLKKNNLKAVFGAVADQGCDTRARIAEFTGLSIVTTGKAAEAFLDAGIFIQHTTQVKQVGRRASKIRVNPKRHFAVADLSQRNFSAAYYNLSLGCVNSKEYEYISDFSYPENLGAFLHRMKTYMEDAKDIKYLSVCIIVPGSYERATDIISQSGDGDIERIRVREFAKKTIGLPVDIMIDHMSAAVRYCAASHRQEGNVLYVNTRSGIDSRLIIKGRVLKKQGSCGALRVSSRGIEADISDMVRSMCNTVGLSEVVVESEELAGNGNAGENIRNAIMKMNQIKDIPAITISSQRFASCGAALISRDNWLEKLLR